MIFAKILSYFLQSDHIFVIFSQNKLIKSSLPVPQIKILPMILCLNQVCICALLGIFSAFDTHDSRVLM